MLVERLWKSAAVIGLLTAPLQLICGFGNPVFSFPLTVQQQIVENSATLTASRTADGLTELQPSPVSMASASTSTSTNEDTVPIVAGTESPAPSEPPVMTDANVETVLAPSTVNVHTNDSHPISDIVPSIAAYSADEISAEVVGRPRSLPVLATGFAGAAMVIVVLGSLHFLAASRSFRRRIRRFKPMQSGPVEAALSNLIRRHRLRRPVQLLEADELGEPIAFGVWHWTIVVPGGIESRLDKGELKALLAHELAHLVRGDAWWLLIGRLLCGCLPFQPLNFLARRCWRRAVEFQCDDWAADCTKNPLILARCLTRVAEWRLNDTNLAHALPARGSHSTLSCRVERLLAGRSTTDPWRRSRQRRLLTVLTMTVATLLCWIGPRTTLLAHIDDRIGNSDAIDNLDSVSVDEIQLLNAELRQLETRLRKVAQLLSNSNAPPEMRTLAAGLVSRMTDLRRHRRELLARVHLQSERPPTPGTTNSTSTNPVAINDTERPKLDSTLSVIARD